MFHVDFQVLAADFSATTITFVALSPQAKARLTKAFGLASVSFDVPKSTAPDVFSRLESEGFKVEVAA